MVDNIHAFCLFGDKIFEFKCKDTTYSSNKDEFCKKHRQYYKFCPYLHDRPSQPWTEFSSEDIKRKSTFRLTKKGGRSKNHNKTKRN